MSKEKNDNQEVRYTVAEILKMKRYANRRDLLGALLDSEKAYTHKEIIEAITDYMGGEA